MSEGPSHWAIGEAEAVIERYDADDVGKRDPLTAAGATLLRTLIAAALDAAEASNRIRGDEQRLRRALAKEAIHSGSEGKTP